MKNISSVQEAIWLTQNIYVESPLYNVGGYALIEGNLNEKLLISSIEAVLKNADVIESGYHAFDSIRQDNPSPSGEFDIATIDLLGVESPDQSCLEWMQADMYEKLDVKKNLLKIRILKSHTDRYYWYTKVHHLIFDGYSMSLFFREVSSLYSARTDNRLEEINPSTFLYSDFIENDKAYRQSDEFRADRKFWLDRLEKAPRSMAFQSSFQFPYADSLSSSREELLVKRDFYDLLSSFCKQHNCTTFHYFLAALIVLNHCYNNENSVIGVPVFNRRNKRAKNTLGTFVNMLPFSIEFGETQLFIDLLYTVRDQLKDCYKHQRFSLYNLLDELDRGGSIYNISFSYQKNSYDACLGDLTTSIKYLHSGQQQEHLAFHLLEYSQTDDLRLSVDYRKNLFSRSSINNLLDHFDNLLHTLFTTSHLPIGQLEYLNDKEKDQLLSGFNNTLTNYSGHKTIVELFEYQAHRVPDLIAVSFAGKQISYKELNERSNQLARYLSVTYNIKGNDLIGIKLERSEWLIIAILGVLKSGGAYIPIDPDYPQERINYIISDSSCKALIDEAELTSYGSLEYAYSTENLSPVNKPGDLIYVIYTSGSTGQPKGCLLEHRGVVNRLEWMWHQFDFNSTDVILQKTTFTFDVSVWELLLPICWGAKMVICQKQDIASPERIVSLIEEQGVTSLHFVPAMLSAFIAFLAESGDPGPKLKSLRRVITSGEALLSETVKSWYSMVAVPIHNLYGPTEASIDVSWYTTSAEDTFIPIGRPIWNTQLYIISRSNQLLPVETAGEICIGGVGLAQGYLNKPALTAEKFVQSSFRQGDRLYKTGDTGKWLPDGNIAFLGRNDNQVKIRGYRVEPGEIENALQSHPNIDAAVVITRELAGGIKDLIAYIVTNEPLTDTDIRVHIGRILPAYMLPGLIIRIKSLPLTASGKIDRKQLPAATGPALTGGIEYIAPRGPIEQRLATIWREVLALEQIGVQDEFFARGGHSLKAIRLASRIHKEFDVKIELSQLFKTTVLEEQAWLIAQTTRTLFSGIIPAGQQSHYPLSSSQRRLWVLSQFEGGSIAYNMPGAYVLNGSLNLAALTHSFTTLIGRHEILRTVFREDEKGEPRQFICPEQQAAISINCLDLRQQEQPDEKLQSLLKISFTRPFDLYTGPLLRAELYQLSENKWVISFVMHHIISDGWSLDVLIRELLQFYNAYADGSTFSLPPLTIQYKDYTVWQQAQLSGEDLDIHRQYWMAQFQGELPVLEMPADKLRPAIKTYHGGVVHKKINAGLTEAIRDYSRRQGGTLFMNLLAALSALLYRYTGQTDFIIGTPVAGRDHLDLEGQIGLYVNMLALRIAFGSDHNYQELAAMVKKITLSAYQHQNFPFDTLVDELKLHRDTSRSPLFDVMIVLQNEEKDLLQEIRPGEITVERITATDETTSKFDLTFNFIERAGQLELAIEYNNHIYEFSSVSRMAGHFERLLDEMLRNPAVPVGQLSYISCEEKQHLLEVFNNTLSPYPMDETVITLFEKRVALSPGNIAILFEDTSITYAELNEWANRLGNYLRDKYGVGEGRPVGIKLERSEWMIIAILGVLKSGGSYVPIDPDYPRERIEYMLKDSKCGVLIDEDGLSAFRQEKDNYETRNLPSLTKPDDPIYIIYTSGSTGRPKGAMVKHHSFVNLALWYERLLELSEKDCVLLMAPISFDLAQKNIFTTLLRGAKLCLPGKLYGDYMLLAETIQQNKVTVINAAPSAFYPLLDTSINGEFKRLSSLRKIVLGGEPIMTKEFLNWVESGFYNGQVINSYGPTECTDVVSSFTIDNTAWTTLKKVPIGVPIDNSRIYILDNRDGLVPVGIDGEIHIGGTCLGLGYLDQPDMTAEKFVINPFRQDELLYRTGDIGRWLPDGNVSYIGRKDNQVKIRGFRIELDEIERVLQEHPDIDAAVVVVHEPKDKKLVAYVTGRNELPLLKLREYLNTILPGYMIPDYFVQLEKLPQTPSGKLDRRQLPEPDYSASHSLLAYIAPRTVLEEQMTQIWQEILGKEKIGIKDNFFQLGGHSLKAVQLISRINRAFLVRINIQSLFIEPTIENICEQIAFVTEQGKMKTNKDSLVQIEI